MATTFNEVNKLLNSMGYEVRQKPTVRENALTRMLREDLHPSKWEDLADRSKPLPPGFSTKRGLELMSQILAGCIELAAEKGNNQYRLVI